MSDDWLTNQFPAEFKYMYVFHMCYCYSLRKVLFIEKADHYYKIDNWPPENERKYYNFLDFLNLTLDYICVEFL